MISKWKENKIAFIVALIVIICLLAGGSAYGYQHHQETVKKQAKVKLDNERKAYIKALNSVKGEILKSAILSEDMNNTYSQVWHDVIINDSVDIAGVTYTDMDSAISAQIDYYDFNGDIDKLESQQQKIKKEIKNLNKYPKGYKMYNDLIVEYYQTYKQFSDLALNPSGNYQSYRDTFSKLDDKLVSQYDEMDIKLP